MTARRTHLPVLFVILTLLGCDRPDAAGVAAPRFTVAGVGRPSVLVNPNANDHGTAKTIQEGIDMVASGGNVLVEPGTYVEAIVIDKGLTLEAIGGESGAVIVAPVGTVNAAIRVATPDAVAIRGLTVRYTGTRGIFGDGVVALTNGGGYAEYVAVPAGQILPAPANWSLTDAAALPETWFTVTQTLVMRAGLEPGMTVLITGAAGGIGGAAIQICKIYGAEPIALSSGQTGADMRAFLTLVIYVAPFLAIGIAAKVWMRRKVALSDVRAEGNPKRGRARFLLGIWRSEGRE